MKKGSIVKGKFIIGVLNRTEADGVSVKYVTHPNSNILYANSFILTKNLRTPTKKEKEEYKKLLLKNGYSYYRGRVIKEL